MEKEKKLPALSDRLLMCYQLFEAVRHLEVGQIQQIYCCYTNGQQCSKIMFRKSVTATEISSQTTSSWKTPQTGLLSFFLATGAVLRTRSSLRMKSRLVDTIFEKETVHIARLRSWMRTAGKISTIQEQIEKNNFQGVINKYIYVQLH